MSTNFLFLNVLNFENKNNFNSCINQSIVSQQIEVAAILTKMYLSF